MTISCHFDEEHNTENWIVDNMETQGALSGCHSDNRNWDSYSDIHCDASCRF